MNDRLTEFLERVASRPFVWGQDDCSLFMADWWLENHGVDPAASVRGTYANEDDCTAMVLRAGSLLGLASGMAEAAGMRVANPVRRGDFGVIAVGRRVAGGIFCGDYWAVRNEGVGFVTGPRVLRAWAI